MDEIFYKSARHGIHKVIYVERMGELYAGKDVNQRTHKSICAERELHSLFMNGRAGSGVVQYSQLQVEVIEEKRPGVHFMGSSPYIWKINSKLQGNTIESRDIAEVRRDIINDIRRLKTVIENHASEVEDIYFMADNTMLLPDGYWSHGTPDGLSRQAMELEDHYERMDYNAKQSLFADIFSADREVSQSGIYEKRGSQIIGKAALVDIEVSNALDSAFDDEYHDYAMGNIRSEQQAARAVEDTEEYLESLRNRYGRIPVYTPGVYRKVEPETYLDTLPQERQDYLRKLAREAGLEGMRRGKEDSKRRT